MSDDGGPLRILDDGSELWELEDGGLVLFDATGEPIQAEDADGEAFDPTGIEYPTDIGYDEADPVEQQIAELQEWRENFDPIAMREEARAAGAAASGARGDEAWAAAARTGACG